MKQPSLSDLSCCGFEFCLGSVIGAHHHRLMKNNQDSWCYRQSKNKDGVVVGVVCDGCGSGTRSETGAILGASFIADSLLSLLSRNFACKGIDLREIVEMTRYDLIGFLKQTAYSHDRDYFGTKKDFIENHFLFTIVGFILTDSDFCIFYEGDGYYQINDELTCLESEGNAPSYTGYHALNFTQGGMSRVLWKTKEVDHFMIGTDGLRYIINKPAGEEFSSFFDDQYYKNPEAMNRRLRILNEPKVRLDSVTHSLEKKGYALDDDVTLICGRRKNIGQNNDYSS